MPELPVSGDAIRIALNLMTLWFIAPAFVSPRRGWFSLAVTFLFCLNVVLTAVNVASWLGLMR